MKFMCEGLVLSDAAITVSKACASRTTMPVLECIKMTACNDGVTLVAYDGELSIEKKIKADVLEEGEICTCQQPKSASKMQPQAKVEPQPVKKEQTEEPKPVDAQKGQAGIARVRFSQAEGPGRGRKLF